MQTWLFCANIVNCWINEYQVETCVMLIVQVTASNQAAVAVGRVTQVTDQVTEQVTDRVTVVTDRVITVIEITVTQVTRIRTVVPAIATTTIPGNCHSTACI